MKQLLPLIFIGFSYVGLSQYDPCITEDKKLLKMLSTAMAEKTFEKQTEKFVEAIQKYPNNAQTYYLYAKLLEQEAARLSQNEKTKGQAVANKNKALLFYQNTIKKCPEYHAEIYYMIGANLYQNGDVKNALTYFQKFLDFPQDDFNKLPPNNAQLRKELTNIVEDLNFEKMIRENPVPFQPSKVMQVSSPLDEYFPMISPDNDLLFFTRKVDRKNLGDIASNIREEFTLAYKLDAKGEFNYGDPLPKPFNDGTFFNYGSATLSVDNKEMILCACKVEKVYNQDYLNCDLYTTSYRRTGKGGNDFEWTPLVNMGSNINTKDGWEAQPSLSADGKTLFFTSIRKGSRDNDIYISERQKDGSWSPAKPFDLINTDEKDKSPFFHQDGETLYFVSTSTKKRRGVGGLDIFYIRKEGDGWTAPKNIGYPINSPEDELGLFVSTNGRVAYYSTYKDGNWNIYSFELYEDARPQEVLIVKGELKDEKGNPITDASIEITYNGTGEKESFSVNGDDGKYAAVVKTKNAQDVTISVKKEGYAYNAQIIEKEKLQDKSLNAVKIEKMTVDTLTPGKTFSIADIYFGTDSYELNAKSKTILSGLADYLVSNSSLQLSINGHTDDIGDNEKNRQLSQNRSDAVKRFLVEKGVAESRLKAVGYGESKPKFPNNSELNRAKNRRTEFEVIDF